jgi:hypothetical protein
VTLALPNVTETLCPKQPLQFLSHNPIEAFLGFLAIFKIDTKVPLEHQFNCFKNNFLNTVKRLDFFGQLSNNKADHILDVS